VGKSTLFNRLLGAKVAIVSPKPQTTWNKILGVKTLPEAQILFVDTPGIHETSSKFNNYMLKAVRGALRDADLILHMVEALAPVHRGEELVWDFLKERRVPVIVLVNKVDLLRESDISLDLSLPYQYTKAMRISALLGTEVDELEREIVGHLPVGPQYYPDDYVTDLTERFITREIIREKIFQVTHQEIPYSCAVVVEDFKETERGMIVIRASINVARESQKGIVIGKRGTMVREVGRLARLDLEPFFNARVYLELWVRVQKDWTKKDHVLREFGLTS